MLTEFVGLLAGPGQAGRTLSPAIHQAAFRAMSLDWVYLSFPVAVDDLAPAVRGLAVLGAAGFNVTMPHKVAVAAEVDELVGAAAPIGAVNTVAVREGRTTGYNTDAEGLIRYLELDLGVRPEGLSALIVGAGGAAMAAVHALAGAKASRIRVAARRQEAALGLARLAEGSEFDALDLADLAGYSGDRDDLIINATPLGQLGEETPIPPRSLGKGVVVVDLVYLPPVTRLIQDARRRGAVAHGGMGMLVHQAALALEIWTGKPAPLETMSAAAVAAARSDGLLKTPADAAD